MRVRSSRRPAPLSSCARLLVGAVTAATAFSVVAPLTANAQSEALGSLTGSLGSATGSMDTPQEDRYPTEPLPAGPEVEFEIVHEGLSIPWDVVSDPDGVIVTGERGTGRVVAISPDGSPKRVEADFGNLFTGGEAGLMGIALAHDFANSREVYTCHSDADAGDSRITAWRAADDWSALESPEVILPGIARQNIGHHSGCRILAHPDGSLYIGTGDTFNGHVPQDMTVLGGKVLHVKRDGTPAADTINGSPILTFGHRNVQGLALQPGTGRLFSAEHGTKRDDEINLLQPGGNYGWDPLRVGINERNHDDDAPMTDLVKFPDAIEATWSSGDPSLAASGITFLDDPAWGKWNGALAVAMLKTKQIALITLSEDGTGFSEVSAILPGEIGRIRSLTREAGGTLLATTSNGGGKDMIVRIRPVVE